MNDMFGIEFPLAGARHRDVDHLSRPFRAANDQTYFPGHRTCDALGWALIAFQAMTRGIDSCFENYIKFLF
jgi:hypothetical protein